METIQSSMESLQTYETLLVYMYTKKLNPGASTAAIEVGLTVPEFY